MIMTSSTRSSSARHPALLLFFSFLVVVAFILDNHGVNSAGITTYPNSPDSAPPSQWSSMSNHFDQHCSPFGVSMFAKDWPRDKFLHACNVLAQMLDNDQDGCADDIHVVNSIRTNQAGMVMFASSGNSVNYDIIASNFQSQGLFADETNPGCSGSSETSSCFDAALEEILHVVTAMGVGPAYPAYFSDCGSDVNNLSLMQQQMDIARGGHFINVPTNYPPGSVFHYDDTTCDYECMGTEFLYWAATSLLNGQDARADRISVEWEASTPALVQSKLPGMYNLLANNPTTMKLLSLNGVLPGGNSSNGATGTYRPSSQTCPNGCGLDGSGCGPLGNSNDVNRCTSSPSVPTAPTPTAPTPTAPTPTVPTPTAPTPTTGEELNGEEACENHGYTQNECLNVGDGSCCQWDVNECWSAIGRQICPGTGSPTAPTPTAPTPTAPTPTVPTPTAPTPTTGEELNGEEACENHGYTQNECLNVGDGSCCQWDVNECWSAIGRQICPGTGSPTAPTPTAPTPTAPSPSSSSCVDSQLRFKVRVNGKNVTRDCNWVSNVPDSRCSLIGVSYHCPGTCGTCYPCLDGLLKFKVQLSNGKNRFRNCLWANKNPASRCALDGVDITCRNVCGKC